MLPHQSVAGATLFLSLIALAGADTPKQAIAHRGASAYAPEHTLAAYRLAIEMKADFVEPDLAVTKDGVLICLHDDTLERTTNIADVFGDRASTSLPIPIAAPGPHWLANDFTLEEIKRLDAGRWFKREFTGERVVAFEEMIDLVRAHRGTGIYPELKSPQLYEARHVDMEQLFVRVIKKHGLDTRQSLTTTPVVIQSFDEASIRRVAADLPAVPRVFLTSEDADVTDARLGELAKFATGIAPDKVIIARHPDMVRRAHAAGLTVTAWTFRADEKSAFPTVRDEMSHFLFTLGIDALFTNNPDQFPRTK
ncbi:MAG TPA: glycerophosphodiester phosphodiesterase family protein [Vicinamibacterales bacterium]